MKRPNHKRKKPLSVRLSKKYKNLNPEQVKELISITQNVYNGFDSIEEPLEQYKILQSTLSLVIGIHENENHTEA